MNPLRRSTLLFAVFLSFSAFAFGQTGFPTGITRGSSQIKAGPVNIDMATGNMVMDLPVRKKIGAFPFAYDLVYNLGNAGAANTAGVVQGAMTGGGFPVLQKPRVVLCSTPPNVTATYGDSLGFGFSAVDPLGGLHATVLDGPVRVGPESGCGDVGPVTSVSNDGTGYTAIITGSALASGSLTWTVYNKQGLYTASTSNILSDADGNTASLSSGGTKTWTDTMGLPAMNIQLGGGSGASDNYYYADSSGTNQYFTVTYGAQQHVKTVFGCSAPLFPDVDAMRYLPRSIVTPAGTYSFTYEQTGTGYGTDVTGRMAKVTLPTGGYVSFTYSGGTLGFNCLSRVIPTLKVTVNDNNGNTNTTTYVNTNNVNYQNPCCSNYNVTVTGNADPDNGGAQNVTVNSFSGEFLTQSVAYEGAATGTPLSIILTCYNGNTTNCASNPPPVGNGYLITRTDTYTAYNATSITTANSKEEITTYDCFAVGPCYGNVTSVANYDYGHALLSTTSMTYTGCGVDPAKYIFDRPCSITTLNGSSGKVSETLYTYNSTGHPTQTKKWVSASIYLTSSASFNANGTTNTVTDANGAITTFNSDGSCNSLVPTSVTLPTVGGVTMTTSQVWDCNGGVVTSTSDANIPANVTHYKFIDPLWRLTEVDKPDGGVSTTTYNTAILPWTISTCSTITPSSSCPAGTNSLTEITKLDGLGRAIQSQVTSDPNGTKYQDTAYDVLGRHASTSNPYYTTGDATYGLTTYSYDALGRKLSVTHPDSTVATFGYSGSATSSNDEGNGTVHVQHLSQEDGLGHVVKVCETSGTTQLGTGGTPGACGLPITGSGFLSVYGYDPLGNLLSVTQGTETRSYSYDGLSRMTAEFNPETGNKSYTYDNTGSAGDLYQRTAPKPNQSGTATVVTTYAWDKLHRLLSKSYTDGTATDSFAYDQSSAYGFSLGNSLGRMSFASASSGATTLAARIFSYDPVGRTTDNSQCVATFCSSSTMFRTFPYAYNQLGQTTSSSAGWGGITYSYVYNNAGILTGVTSSLVDSQHPANLLSAVQYNALGEQTSVTMGNGLSLNGIVEHRAYDVRGRETSLGSGVIGGPGIYIFSSVQYAPDGDLLGITDSILGGTWTYTYDDLNRLHTSSASGSVYGSLQSFSFAYDRFGNRWQQNITSGTGPAPSYSFTANNRISGAPANCTSANSYCYDSAGNLLNDSFHKYTYDAEGRVLTVDGTTTYTYDALGKRVQVTGGGTTTYFGLDLEGRSILEYQSATGIRFEAYAGSRQLVTYRNGLTYFDFPDLQGTVRVQMTEDGTHFQSRATLPFGDDLMSWGTDVTGPLHFTGQDRDTESNLDHFQFRNYSSTQGNWAHPDPSGLASVNIMNPQSWNLYAYVMNNPLTLTDPLGLEPGVTSGSTSVPEQSCTTSAADGSIRCVVTAPPNAPPATPPPTISAAGYSAFREYVYSAVKRYIETIKASRQRQGIIRGEVFPIGLENVEVGAAEPATSPTINPSEVTGKTPVEIDTLAKEKGLIPKGPDPMNGRGSYVDPVTGEQRILSHPDAEFPHAHVNDPSGARLNLQGNPVSPESPDAHLPIGEQ